MQARVKVQNDITVVPLSGRIDVETAEPFRAALNGSLKGKRLVFDFSMLSFVGSQGILPFLETLQGLQESQPGSFKFSGVGMEFRKLFAATPLSIVEIYDSIDQAVMAFYVPRVVEPVIESFAVSAAVQAAPMATATPADFIAFRSEPDEAAKKASESYDPDEELDA